jgi:MtN3 and saliva related transmembrane protein
MWQQLGENLSGGVALITSIIGLFPQVYKSYKTRSTMDVSMIMLANYLVCSVAWIIHGLYTGSKFVVYSNIIGTILSMVSIVQKFVYDKNSRRSIGVQVHTMP